MQSQVYRLLGPRQLVLETQELPRPGKGEIRARTLASALSPGTEVAAYRGDPPLRPMKVYPRVLGYCNVAQVESVGEGVEGLAPGDLVYTHQCHRSAFVCPQDKVLCKLPPGADPVTASTTYLFHLGYHALLRGGFTPGENLAVIGLGVLGLGTVAVGRMSGAGVLALSNRPEARQKALALGARQADPAGGHDAACQAAQEVSRGVGIDLVVSTSNAWDDFLLALKLARPGGRICLMGFPGRTEPIPPFNPLASQYLYDKQLTITTCGHTPDRELPPQELRFTLKRNLEFLMERVVAGDLPAAELISRVDPWQELDGVYRRFLERRPELITCVLDWRD